MNYHENIVNEAKDCVDGGSIDTLLDLLSHLLSVSYAECIHALLPTMLHHYYLHTSFIYWV